MTIEIEHVLIAFAHVLSFVLGYRVGRIRTRRRYVRSLQRAGSRFGAEDL